MNKTALSIFVKTPSLSPVKTRLAKVVGERSALEFYDLACRCMEEIAKKTNILSKGRVIPIWSIAESEGAKDERWKAFDRIYQGDGGLGERLHHIYQELGTNYSRQIFIGSDSPQLSPSEIISADQMLEENDFVLGPALDGGFYLFGGKKHLPYEAWSRVTYSVAGTAQRLGVELQKHGELVLLNPKVDVDTGIDLTVLRVELRALKDPLPVQKRLLDWIDDRRRFTVS